MTYYNLNWYEFARNIEKIHQEASAKDWLSSNLLAALIAVLSGQNISEAAQNNNVTQTQIEQSLNNKPLLDELSPNKISNNITAEQEKIIDILARTVWAEARGEPIEGQKAVISVILNRAKNNPNNIVNVILKREQFSCWNNGTPSQGNGNIWDNIVQMSTQAVLGNFQKNTFHDHYFNPKKTKKGKPYWGYVNGNLRQPNVFIGNHVFMSPNKKP